MSIWTVVSNGLALGWLIALHVNRIFKSWRPSGPIVISLLTLLAPFVSYVSLIIGMLSLYQCITGVGLPGERKNKIEIVHLVRMQQESHWCLKFKVVLFGENAYTTILHDKLSIYTHRFISRQISEQC